MGPISGQRIFNADDTQVDIEWNGVHYLVTDREFQGYLSRVCAGVDVAAAAEASAKTPACPQIRTRQSRAARRK